MPYPPELLNSHEKIVLDIHPHWWYFLEPALGAIAALFLLAVFGFKTDGGVRSVFVTLLLLVILGLAVWALVRLINWRSIDFVVTTDRVIFRSGVFAKHGIEIPLERVNNVNFSQGIFERMVGAGDLMIESGGEDGQPTSPTSASPQQIQRIIHEQIEQYRQRGMGTEDLRHPAAQDGRLRRAPPAPRRAAPVERGRRDRQAGDAAPEGHDHAGRVRGAEAEAAGWLSRGASAPRRQPGPLGHRDAAGLVGVARSRAPGSASSPSCPHVGGTKDPDVAAIVALAPDLVVVNDEENRREDADALAGRRAAAARDPRRGRGRRRPVPRRARRGGRRRAAGAGARGRPRLGSEPPVAGRRRAAAAFVPIWRRPWMTMNARHLRLVGARPPRRRPTCSPTRPSATRPSSSTRSRPAVPTSCCCPSEPYPFRERHVAERRRPWRADVRFVDGQDLFWWGVRTPAAIDRLRQSIGA